MSFAKITSLLNSLTSVEILLAITLLAAIVWLALETFLYWRRQSTNLTPVATAKVNQNATADFLAVDQEARAAALGRADAFEKKLQRREAKERSVTANAGRSTATRMAGLITLALSVLSLAALIVGAIWKAGWIGAGLEGDSAAARLVAVAQAHPFAILVSVSVIAFHVVSLRSARTGRAAV